MQLRVVSYNIHRAIGVDRRFRLERIIEIIRNYSPDVALLQEVDDGAPRSNHLNLAVEIAQALGFEHIAVGHNVRLRQGRYGNATLSRYPIARERNIDLTISWRKPRGCQHTTLHVEKPNATPREIDIFNMHLGLSASERAKQVGILVRSSEFANVGDQKPCLVGGDMNDWRNALGPMFTEILGFKCATARKSSTNGCIRTYPSFSPTGGLDKLYVRGPIRVLDARPCRLSVSRVASDHLPIIVDLQFH